MTIGKYCFAENSRTLSTNRIDEKESTQDN
jgi:hypothetical protein